MSSNFSTLYERNGHIMALLFKLCAAGLIFAAAFLGGLIPLVFRNNKSPKYGLFYAEFFARGIFLSAGLIHLLPDANTIFHHVRPEIQYPVIFALCVFTIFVIQLTEQWTSRFAAKKAFSQHWLPYLLLILLSIHSVIAGAALGIDNNLTQILVIFFAIISHKSAESFALGVSMQQHQIPQKIMLGLLILFSLMTPLGIIASSMISSFLNSTQTSLAQAIFTGIASGTFLYIASFKTTDLEGSIEKPSNLIATGFFGLGLTLMAVIAFFGI